jgi:general secretion pathway protein G
MKRQAAFSLIELVIAMAILGLLASMAAPLAETVIRRGKEQELKVALYEIRDAIDAYKLAADAGHIEKSAASTGYPPSLQVLVDGVRDLRSVKGERIYFLRRIPRDPFVDSRQEAAESWGLRAYNSPANDPRPGVDVFDVYSLAKGDGLDGTPYREW